MRLKFLRLPDKDALAGKLIDYPLLDSILRVLLYERLFRIALVGLLLLIVATSLFVTKFITVSPKNFTPVFKISGLDYLQAWSLRRAAINEAAAGHFDEALYSWRMAV